MGNPKGTLRRLSCAIKNFFPLTSYREIDNRKNRYLSKMSFLQKIAVSFILGSQITLKKWKYSPFDEESNAFFKNSLAGTVRELFKKNRFWSLVIRYVHRYSQFLERCQSSFLHGNDASQIVHQEKLQLASSNCPFRWSGPENHWFFMIFQ